MTAHPPVPSAAPEARDNTLAYPVADVEATVITNEQVNEEYFHLVLAAPVPAPSASAGQFFNLECPGAELGKPYLRRPMSVYRASPDQGRIEFLYKMVGLGTHAMATLRPGQRMRAFGPLGNGFSLEPSWQHIVVLGRGVGLATLAPLAEMARGRGVAVTAILSARSQAHILSQDRFRVAGAEVRTVVDADGSSETARVEALLRDLNASRRIDAFYTCGSNRLMVLLQSLAREIGISGEVAMEQRMACGIGMCFCCVRDFRTPTGTESRRVCLDGPVFKLEEVITW